MSTRTSSLIGRCLAALLLLSLFSAAIAILGLRYYVWPRLDQWRPSIVAALSRELGRPVTIDKLDTAIHGWRPALTIRGFALHDADGRQALKAESAVVDVALSRLVAGRPAITSLLLVAPSMNVEYFGAGQWRIAGFDHAASDAVRTGDERALRTVLGIPRIEIRDGRVELIDRVDDGRLTADGVGLAVRHDDAGHQAALTLPGADGGDSLKILLRVEAPASLGGVGEGWRADGFVSVRGLPGPTLAMLGRLVVGHRLAAEAVDVGAVGPGADQTGTGQTGAGQTGAGQTGAGPSGADNTTAIHAATEPAAVRDADRSRMPVAMGDADLMAWGRWQDGALDDVLVKLDARRPRWRFDEAGRGAGVPRLRAEWRMARVEPGRYRVDMVDARASLPGGAELAIAEGSQLWLSEAGALQSAHVVVQPFDLAGAASWAAAQRWPAGLPQTLDAWSIGGRMGRLQFDWRAAGSAPAEDRPSWRVEAEFDRLAAGPRRIVERRAADGLPLPSTPSVENAAGRLIATDAGGQLQVGGGKGAAWSFPGLFAVPRVVFDRWSARLDWQHGAGGDLRIRIQEARFANPDADGTVAGSIRIAGDRSIADLTGRLQRARATSVARYLPLSVSPAVRDWVARAVEAGESDAVTLVLRGDLHDFPFERPGMDGQFRVDVALRGGRLRFEPDWPPLDQITGHLTFERASFSAAIDGATLHGVQTAGTRLRIPDFHHGVLGIEGRTTAPASRLIGLVNASPLDHFVNGALREASATNDVDLKLSARIPLHAGEHDTFQATLALHDNDFLFGPGKPVLGALRGVLAIGHDGVAARDVSGRLLGGPVRIDASAPAPGHVTLRARGGLSLDGLRTLADNPLTRKLDGHADYEADVDIDARGVKLTLSSDLVGVASDLPAPFAKRTGVALPLRVVSSPAPVAADGFVTTISLGDAVRMRIARRFDAKAGRALIDRAAFAMNTEPVLPETGLSVALHLPRVDFDAWGAAMATAAIGQPDENLGGEFAPGFSLLPKHVSVLTDELLVGGKQLHDVVFGATRQQGVWQANVSAREVDGYFSWRDAPPGQPLGKLTARFTRLEIPPSRRQEIESILETDRTDLPELDITAEELVLNNHRLGRLELLAGNGSEAGRPAWKLQHLRIAHPTATLDASGIWTQRSRRDADPATRMTSLDFKLDLRDSGALLNDLGIRDAIRGAAGTIQGRLDWAGSPLAIDYPSLHGRIDVGLGKGQFLKTDPGLAKLIGVLNLQSLPRRLSLDFRDVFAEGFAFDDIHGDVRVDHGVAYTDDLKMNGVQARVHLKGEADLARETQSLDVEVRPHLNAGLASLAYAAVNPVIGLGSFLAQFMLRAPLEQAFTYQYRVTGSWADPTVVEKSRPQPLPDRQPAP